MSEHSMSEPSPNLFNCSSFIQATGPFIKNVSSIWSLNESQLFDLISQALSPDDTFLTEPRKNVIRESLTDCLFSKRSYELAWWQQVTWTVLFTGMLFVAVTGNATVAWIVLAHRRMRTVTNYYLVNLSVADLLMALLNCSFNFFYMIFSNWPFGSLYCSVNNFVANVTVTASVFTLVAITVDRYTAIMRPLHHRMSRVRSWVIIALIWVLSCSLACPGVLFSNTMTIRYANGQSKTVCFVQWPDGRFPSSETEYVYNIIFLGVTYLIPVLLMGVCYFLMGRELWGSRSIGEQTSRQLDAIKSKRKVIRMFIVVVTIFAVCWLPYHAYYIIIFHRRELSRSAYVHHLYLLFYWLAMSNAMVNPLIYYWMNRKFRVYFRQAICHCFCLRPNYKHDLEVVTGVKRGGSVSNFNRSCRSVSLNLNQI
ncbi:tachykinin-like peptides receptor 86C isoform X2 [Bemisia tabaci]